jgi:hypothetical protein
MLETSAHKLAPKPQEPLRSKTTRAATLQNYFGTKVPCLSDAEVALDSVAFRAPSREPVVPPSREPVVQVLPPESRSYLPPDRIDPSYLFFSMARVDSLWNTQSAFTP